MDVIRNKKQFCYYCYFVIWPFSFLLDNVTSLGLVFFLNCTELFNSVQLKPSGKGQNTPAAIRYLKHRSKYVLYGALLK